MRLLERILVATDLSQAADDAVGMAQYLAASFQSEVLLVHVIPPLAGAGAPSEAITNQIAKYLSMMREKLSEAGISVREPVLTSGTPAEKIVDVAEEHDVNVIIVGSGEKEEGDPYRMGITTERIERRAQTPVLVVKRGAPPSVSRIVCPVDGSQTSGRALREAIHLARNLQAQLTVLTVVQPLTTLLPRLVSVPEEDKRKHREDAEARFKEFLSEFDFHQLEPDVVTREGQPHEEIVKVAAERQADLLVMGTVGRTGAARFFLGSVTEKVARQLPCSLMTVKSEDFIRLQLHEEIQDIRAHVQRAEQLLDKGFASEALGEFRLCIAREPMYAPAWEGAAAAHDRLGNSEEAEQCRKEAHEIIQTLWDRRVEAEIRSERLLWRKR